MSTNDHRFHADRLADAPGSRRAAARTVERGADAESLAARHLEGKGLSVIARNHRTRFGEIDLVMRDGGTLVFVEVRLRCTSAHGGAAASIDHRKQQKLLLAARHYLGRLAREPPCRFDAVLLDALDPSRIEWVRNVIA